MGLLGGKKSKQIVGLDIGSSSIKAVELKATKAGYELVSFGMESLAPDTVVDGAIMDAPQVANAISKIFDAERIKIRNVATSVSGHSVIVKRVPLPLMTEEELYDRIPSEAGQRADGGAAEHRRERDEHQHRARRDSAVHARRERGWEPIHGRAAKGTGPEL